MAEVPKVTDVNVINFEEAKAKREQAPPHRAFTEIPNPQERLTAINDYLKSKGLAQLSTVGNAADPRVGTEFLRIKNVIEDTDPHYKIVQFDTKFGKSDEIKTYNVIFEANGDVSDGAVVIVRLNTKDGETRYVMSEQYRAPQGQRMLELPRGGAKKTDIDINSNTFDPTKLAGITAIREAQEETGVKHIKGFKNIGKLAQDSSTRQGKVDVLLVEADSEFGAQQLDTSEYGAQVHILKSGEIFGGVAAGKIWDQHSLSALFRAALNDDQMAKELGDFLQTDFKSIQKPPMKQVDVTLPEPQKKAA